MDVPVLTGLLPDGTPDPAVAERVARTWLAGGLVGLPTETVYGLAADASDAASVARIYEAKGRPADHPLIVHVAGAAAIAGWSDGDPAVAHRLAEAFWPGPLTLVVRRSDRAGDFLTGGQPTVALRCPGHRVARACIAALAEVSGDPARGVAAPSANRFGRVSPTSAQDVLAELGDRLDPARDLVVDGGPSRVGVESTIVDCTAARPRVVRLGAISQTDIDAALSEPLDLAGSSAFPRIDDGSIRFSEPERSEIRINLVVRAPGTLDSHYAPHARVDLVEPTAAGAGVGALGAADGAKVGLIAVAAIPTPAGWVRLAAPATIEDYARELYAALRRADVVGVERLVAVLPDPDEGPLAHAVRDRLTRAAHRG